MDLHCDHLVNNLINRGTAASCDQTSNDLLTLAQSQSRLLDAASESYVVDTTNTPTLRHEAYRLRHQVYCVEREFEPEMGRDIETDAFDAHAMHVVLKRRANLEVVGTARLVLPQPSLPGHGLPVQALCGVDLSARIPLATSAEVSRFALSKDRRGASCDATALIRLGLVQGLVRLSQECGVSHWCAVMERSLLRLLRYSTIHFEPVGAMIEHHGQRQPAVASIDAVLARMSREQPEIWRYVTLGGSLWPSSKHGGMFESCDIPQLSAA